MRCVMLNRVSTVSRLQSQMRYIMLYRSITKRKRMARKIKHMIQRFLLNRSLTVWQYEMRMDRSEFRYDQFIGKLFNAWRDGRQLRFQQVARMARLRYEDAEDLLCLLIVWNIIEWERGARGLVYQLADASALDELETRGPEQFRWKNYS